MTGPTTVNKQLSQKDRLHETFSDGCVFSSVAKKPALCEPLENMCNNVKNAAINKCFYCSVYFITAVQTSCKILQSYCSMHKYFIAGLFQFQCNIYFILSYFRRLYMCNKCCIYFTLLHMKPQPLPTRQNDICRSKFLQKNFTANLYDSFIRKKVTFALPSHTTQLQLLAINKGQQLYFCSILVTARIWYFPEDSQAYTPTIQCKEVRISVMGKSQMKSHSGITNHLTKRFKSLCQITNQIKSRCQPNDCHLVDIVI